MIGNFLGNVKKPHSYVKTTVATFWKTIGNIWPIFTPTSGHTDWFNCCASNFLILNAIKNIILKERPAYFLVKFNFVTYLATRQNSLTKRWKVFLLFTKMSQNVGKYFYFFQKCHKTCTNSFLTKESYFLFSLKQFVLANILLLGSAH